MALRGPVLVHWTQGRAPIVFTHPRPAGDWTRGALLPGGRGFLLTRELRPDRIQLFCEPWMRCSRVPPPLPVTGVLLERRDATGT